MTVALRATPKIAQPSRRARPQPRSRALLIGFLLVAISLQIGGCSSRRRFVFVDGGAHKGESIANFVDSGRYTANRWEIYAFEANPRLIPEISLRPDLKVRNEAVWTRDGSVEFFLAEQSVSSSILGHKKTGGLSKVPISVPSIDFGRWLSESFSVDDYILVKLDIEGAEYDVLTKMLGDGSIRFVDELHVEFHNMRVGVSRSRDLEIMRELAEHGVPVIEARPAATHGDWFTK